jgi:CheY-like chemotaxis protein
MEGERRVLVVEDDQSWQDLYQEVLTESGYLVDTVTSLSRALHAIDRRFYHVGIVDIRLGKGPKNKDGLKVLERLYELDEGTAVIIASAYAQVSMLEELRGYGVFGLAEKPNTVPAEEIPELEKLKFIKGRIDKGETPDGNSIIAMVERALAEAQRSAVRKIWTQSPFSFLSGVSARDVQHTIGSGQMHELRPFMGKLCRSFMPWLQAKEKSVEIRIGNSCVGFQAPCWSRALGSAIVVRFGRRLDPKQAIDVPPVDKVNRVGEVREELHNTCSSHFEGAVYRVENAGFEEHFNPPAIKRTSKATSAQSS